MQQSPIVEAIFDFRVDSSDQFEAESFRDLGQPWSSQLARVREIHALAAEFSIDSGQRTVTEASNTDLLGFVHHSEDGKRLAQFRRDGFTFNRLRPYTSWDDLLPSVLELWSLYWERAHPLRCVRVGVRSVNELRMPGPVDLKTVLTYPPSAPIDLGNRFESFLTRVTVEDVEEGVATVITQASQASTDHATLVMILDIDTFRFNPGGIQIAEIVELLATLRKSKNHAFRKSLKPGFLRRYM